MTSASLNLMLPCPVTCMKGIVPELLVHQRDARFGLVDVERRPLANRRQQVGKAGGIRVPIAAAVVLEARNRENRRSRTRADQAPTSAIALTHARRAPP